MNAWIFQGSPDAFDVDSYLRSADVVLWRTPQHHGEVAPGDTIYFWRAAGMKKAKPGIVAEGEVIEAPRVQPDDPAAATRLVASETPDEWRARSKIRRYIPGPKHLVSRAALEDDPILGDHYIIKAPQATVSPLTPEQSGRIAALWLRTGQDWTWTEAVAALLAYDQTRHRGRSRRKDSPIANVALRIGRGVGAVDRKVTNFQHLDERTLKDGSPAGAEMDELVWAEFYDTATKRLRSSDLERAVARLPSTAGAVAGTPAYEEDFGPCPPDDPDELQAFARRVRRGQAKLRKTLLRLYDHKCAITGHGPDEVLEAAHIVSHAKTGRNDASVAILLRADLHGLFDDNLIRIRPDDLGIEVDESLKETPYWALRTTVIRDRSNGTRPSVEALRERYRAATVQPG